MKGRSNRCIYCGCSVRGLTCAAHRHLLRVDPMRSPELRVRSEPTDWKQGR